MRGVDQKDVALKTLGAIRSRSSVVGRVWIALAASLLILASCATMPQKTPSEWLSVLPGDATLYASLSVPTSADLIQKVLKEGGPGLQDVVALVDKTKRLFCAVTLQPGSSARFSVLAVGDYPSLIIGMRLSGSREWKQKRGSAGGYWEWNKAGLQVSTVNDFVLLASNGDLEALQRRYTAPIPLRVPPDAASDMASTDLVLYLPELPGGLSRAAVKQDAGTGMRIPVREVWMTASKGQDGYRLVGTANTESEKDAKLMVIVLRLGIVAWMRTENLSDAAARLKSITVSAEGSQVKLAGLTLSDTEVVPLFLSLLKGISPEAGNGGASGNGGAAPNGSPAAESGK